MAAGVKRKGLILKQFQEFREIKISKSDRSTPTRMATMETTGSARDGDTQRLEVLHTIGGKAARNMPVPRVLFLSHSQEQESCGV